MKSNDSLDLLENNGSITTFREKDMTGLIYPWQGSHTRNTNKLFSSYMIIRSLKLMFNIWNLEISYYIFLSHAGYIAQ